MTDVTVGHKVAITVGFVDTNGNPMLQPPAPDPSPPPAWTNTPGSPPVDALTVAADGLSASLDTIAPGGDTIGCTVVVGGVAYSAKLSVNITAAPQVLGGIVLNATVQ